MNISYFPNQIARNAKPVLDAFLQSCRDRGIATVPDSMDADIAVIWSQLWAGKMRKNQLVWQHYRKHNLPVIVLEVGNLKRDVTWRVGLNGINRSGYFGAVDQGPARAQQLGLELTPWRSAGNYILICTQRADSEQWVNQPAPEQWVSDIIKRIRCYTNRPIVVRPHPRFQFKKAWPDVAMHQPLKIPNTYDSYNFDSALDNAWAVVNWNSGPGVEAVMKGVPAFVGASSLAAPVANIDFSLVEQPLRPDRQQWLNDLAYTEWTVGEIAQGLPLQRLLYT